MVEDMDACMCMASRSMVHDKSRQCEEGLLLLMAKWHSRSIV